MIARYVVVAIEIQSVMAESYGTCFIRRLAHYLFRQNFADAAESSMTKGVVTIIDRYCLTVFQSKHLRRQL
jgi:hypothetical protein